MEAFGTKIIRERPSPVRIVTRGSRTERLIQTSLRQGSITRTPAAATLTRAASAAPAAPAQIAVAGLPAQRLTAAMPTGGISVGGITGSITTAGSDIFNAIGRLVPLAIQVVLAVVVIKIVLYLLKGRRR